MSIATTYLTMDPSIAGEKYF